MKGRGCEGEVDLFLPILKPPIDPTLDENQRANSSDEKAVLKILDCREHPRIVT
jgi:hypothetical protein